MYIDSKDISVVVQGAVDFENTPKCLASIRKYLPRAEIILSTWQGSDCSGLDYDILLLNDDPGSIEMSVTEKNNVKRQIRSTYNGICKAGRSYILKIRSDMRLNSSKFLRYFDIYNKYDERWKFVQKRVLVSSLASRDPKEWECPYCLSDWIYFGLKDDLLLIWDIPFPEKDEEMWFKNHVRDIKTIYKYPSLTCKYNPEQFILIQFAKKFVADVSCKSMFDNNECAAKKTINIISNNFVVLSPRQYGFKFQKETRKGADRWHILTHNKWRKLYNECSNGDAFVSPVDFEKISYLPHLWRSKKRLLKQIKKGCSKKALLRNILHAPWNVTLVSSAVVMSIVVPCHGRSDLLKQTLESLSLQTVRNFEVIISDDSETTEVRDEVYNISKQILDRAGICWKYVFTEPNLGQVLNTNQGLKIACGKIIRILHSDDILHPQCIEAETKIFEENKDLAVLYHSHIAFADGMPYFEIKKRKYEYISFSKIVKNVLHSGCAVPSDVSFTRNILEKTGFMDPYFKRACDWDFFYRLIKSANDNGFQIVHIPQHYVGYREHANNNTNNKRLAFINFAEYGKISDKISADMSFYGFTKKEVFLFKKQACIYRYRRLLRELKSLPESEKEFFKPLVWSYISDSSDANFI